jgi:hypothetical protein
MSDLDQLFSYKEESKSREGKFKVDSYYISEWINCDRLSLKIEGLNLDKVYEMQEIDFKLKMGQVLK